MRRVGTPTIALLLVAGAMLRGQSSIPVQFSTATPAQKAPNDPKPQVVVNVPRLKALVEAAEKAIKVEGEEDWDAASDLTGSAEVLIADWPDGELKKPEILALLDRLQQVQKQLDEDEEAATPPAEQGIKVPEEVISLSGEDLRAEMEKVKAAEKGAVFDFPIDLNDKVLSILHTFTTTKRGFTENALSRASQWLPMIRQVFAEEGIPQDLAFLAVIESGFRNEAKSRAAAVGMWQFIRSTGRIYGLTGNAWIEERRDPVKATRAAARYLKRLYQVSGDWYLALAGYNAGPLTPERAVQALGTRNYWDIYRSRFLRNETKNYVPSLCAAILVGRFPERYGLNVMQLRPYAFEPVEIERQTSLSVIARLASTDIGTLRELNPELLRATTPPGHYTLRVPPGLAAPTARALARLPSQQLLDFKSYLIRPGDTLAKVAARFKVTQDDLLAANDLAPSQFRKGRRIQVPPPSAIPIDDRDLLTKDERSKILGDQPLPSLPSVPILQGAESPKPPASPQNSTLPSSDAMVPAVAPLTEPAPPSAAAAISPSAPKFHIVKRKETIYSIATRYGTTVSLVRRWNHLTSNKLRLGQRLKVSAP